MRKRDEAELLKNTFACIIQVRLTCGDPHGKLDPAIAQLIYRIRKGAAADSSEKNFVKGGLAMLEVTFTGPLLQGIERVKRIGFEVHEKSGESSVIGAMPLNKINRLRSVSGILLIAPHRH